MKKIGQITELDISLDADKIINYSDKAVIKNGIRFINGIFTNQSKSLYCVTTNLGIILFSCKKNEIKKLKEIIIPDFKSGILIAIPNHETNLFAIVPNCYKNSSEKKKKIYIYDETKKSINKTLNFKSEIQNLFFTTKKWFIVHTKNSILGFDQINNYQKVIIYEKNEFKQSIVTVSDQNFIFAFLNSNKINLLVFNQQSKNFFDSEHTFKPFKSRGIEYITFSENSKYLLVASENYKTIRIFLITDPKKCITEISLQNNILTNYFFCEIQKIFCITENIILIYYKDNSFRIIDNSKIVDKYIYKTYLYFDFKLNSEDWILEKNEFTNPIFFSEIFYYDENTNTIDRVEGKIYHIDGFCYFLFYDCLHRKFKVEKGERWFNGLGDRQDGDEKSFMIM